MWSGAMRSAVLSVETTDDKVERIPGVLQAESRFSYVDAVKLCRKYSKGSLKDCKQFVDSLVADMEFSDPEKYTYLSASEKGCNVRVLLILAVVSLVIVLLTTEPGSVVLSFFQQL